MRVVHVTEAMGGGLASAVMTVMNAQAAAGAQPHLVFTTRPDTPSDEQLRARLNPAVTADRHSPSSGPIPVSFVAATWRALRDPGVVAVHAHSSWAGIVVRTLAVLTFARAKTYYSPHGFAWLRLDFPPNVRLAFLWAERLMSLVGTLVLVSPSEAELAKRRLWSRHRVVLENAVEVDSLPVAVRPLGARMTVVMCGRICHQKAPWIFEAAASSLSNLADFIWIGDGDEELKRKWLPSGRVRVTGWLSRADVIEQLQAADIMFFPTLWEGMPIALIESQVMGIPAVASRIGGNVDVVADGKTGILADGQAALIGALKDLLGSPERVRIMSTAALDLAPRRFSNRTRAGESLEIYARVVRGVEASS